jgi:Mn2+/Fe2+ NRAMP family transporter
MLWVIVLAAGLMMIFMTLGAKLGAVADATPAELIRRQVGKPLAAFVGLSVLLTTALFQSGNNIGVAAALEGFIDSRSVVALILVCLNAVAIAFLCVFKNLYQMLERVMSIFVAVMLACFAFNLLQLKPDWVAMSAGLLPSLSRLQFSGDMLPILGLMGTTFVVTAAYYQAYLVRQKGWKADQMVNGLLDSRISATIIMLITMMLMCTAAIVFHQAAPSDPNFKLSSPAAVGQGLEKTFGQSANAIFCLGLFSAAYSSYLINSMIGGFMAADGLGWPIADDNWAAKLLSTAVLLVGMLIGLAVLLFDYDRTPMIIVAQAITIVAAPVVAGVLLWLTASRGVMGDYANGWRMNLAAAAGMLILLAMAGKTALVDLPAALFR